MCSNKIEYEETRIAIRRFLPTRYTFGFVALDFAMINAIICNPHLPHYTYDNAGNLVEESNPLGGIFYDYTYYRVLNKRYYMTFSRLGIVQTLRDLPSALDLSKTLLHDVFSPRHSTNTA